MLYTAVPPVHLYSRPMNGEYRTRGNVDREERPGAPGMSRALLMVLLMIVIAAILCVVIYGVMIAIRPIEARQDKKAYEIELETPRSRSASMPARPLRS